MMVIGGVFIKGVKTFANIVKSFEKNERFS